MCASSIASPPGIEISPSVREYFRGLDPGDVVTGAVHDLE
jgi:hypothetical protein